MVFILWKRAIMCIIEKVRVLTPEICLSHLPAPGLPCAFDSIKADAELQFTQGIILPIGSFEMMA